MRQKNEDDHFKGDITIIKKMDLDLHLKIAHHLLNVLKNWWNNKRWFWRFGFSHTNIQSHRTFKLFWNNRKFRYYSKDEADNFNADVANTDKFKSFKCKTELLGNKADQADSAASGILKNALIVASLKYLSNFWRSLEIPLINCKVELRLKRIKYYVLSAAGPDDANGNLDDNAAGNNIIFTKDTNYMFLV